MSIIANARGLLSGGGTLSTKSIVAAVMGLGSLMQVPQIAQPVIKFGEHHPHVASIVGAIVALSLLLKNPQVQDALHKLGIESIDVSTGPVVETESGTVTIPTTTTITPTEPKETTS